MWPSVGGSLFVGTENEWMELFLVFPFPSLENIVLLVLGRVATHK